MEDIVKCLFKEADTFNNKLCERAALCIEGLRIDYQELCEENEELRAEIEAAKKRIESWEDYDAYCEAISEEANRQFAEAAEAADEYDVRDFADY